MDKMSILDPENIRRGPKQVKASICYIFHEGKALMIKRHKEPFFGYFVAPGGKFEEGETPYQCVEREIREETGLKIKDYRLKIVTSELGPQNYNWLLYIFVCENFEGTVQESDEGKLFWIDRDKLIYEKMSEIDKSMLPYVFDNSRYFMKLRYDENKNCTIEEINEIDGEYSI